MNKAGSTLVAGRQHAGSAQAAAYRIDATPMKEVKRSVFILSINESGNMT